MDYTRLFSFAYVYTVILLHMQSGVYGVASCRDTQCTLNFFFVEEGDTPCNQLRPSITDCDIGGPPFIYWTNADMFVEYLLVIIDAGPGGPWYCYPNAVYTYKWITPTWYEKKSTPQMPEEPIKWYDVIPSSCCLRDMPHTYYILLYYVRNFTRAPYISRVTPSIRNEIAYRAEQNYNLSFTLEPYGIKHPEHLRASYHFTFTMKDSCQRVNTYFKDSTSLIPPTSTSPIPPNSTSPIPPNSTSPIPPNATNAQRVSNAGYANAVANVVVMFWTCMVAYMLLQCQ